jgi:hypothetical protein
MQWKLGEFSPRLINDDFRIGPVPLGMNHAGPKRAGDEG